MYSMLPLKLETSVYEERKKRQMKMRYINMILTLGISLLYLASVLFLSHVICMREETLIESINGREKCQKMLEYVLVDDSVFWANNVTLCVWSVQRKSDPKRVIKNFWLKQNKLHKPYICIQCTAELIALIRAEVSKHLHG